MPRKPTNEVIEHRITLGKWERKLLEEKILPVYVGKEIGETSASILQALGSATAGTIGAYVALWGAWKTYPTLKEEMSEHLGVAKDLIETTVEQNTDEETGEQDKGGILLSLIRTWQAIRS